MTDPVGRRFRHDAHLEHKRPAGRHLRQRPVLSLDEAVRGGGTAGCPEGGRTQADGAVPGPVRQAARGAALISDDGEFFRMALQTLLMKHFKRFYSASADTRWRVSATASPYAAMLDG